MEIHRNRDDLSRFLVHLTRDYDGERASSNLISILRDKAINARNAHCLVMHKIGQMGFSKLLKTQFNTVCFTEAPLTQIRQLVLEIEGRKIQLKPYGLVFWKDDLFEKGASPAIYINAKGTSISNFLLYEFDSIFKDVERWHTLKKVKRNHYKNIVHYYSLINVVKDKHDFLWEREWRHHGDFTFRYVDIVAIIANNPDGFERLCRKNLGEGKYNYIKKIPIMSPNWTYEELLEKFAIKLWTKLSKNGPG
ncbi:MAG: hypothetical protein ABSH06_30150 [Thermodesulfobacteriota bacterium]|jgi:hypothetical protein